MKYCSKCGMQLFDDAVICTNCGCSTESQIFVENQPKIVKSQTSGTITAIKVFMIIGTVVMALYTLCIGLAWCLPMTISYCNKVKYGKPISIGFKVCSLLFVNTIAGILMLCDNSN